MSKTKSNSSVILSRKCSDRQNIGVILIFSQKKKMKGVSAEEVKQKPSIKVADTDMRTPKAILKQVTDQCFIVPSKDDHNGARKLPNLHDPLTDIEMLKMMQP